MEKQSQNKSSELLAIYTKIFLEVSQSMQGISYDIDFLIKKYLPELSIIYGYFVEFDPIKNHLAYFIEDGMIEASQRNTLFKPIYIPYFGNSSNTNPPLYKSLRENSFVEFESIFEAPKIYQHLPVQHVNRKEFELISNKYLHNDINTKITTTNDYYVVLFEEIAFFQFALEFVNGKKILDKYKNREEIFLTYLIKFALSVEAKISKTFPLSSYLKLNDKQKWNDEEKEAEIRKEVERKVKTEYSDNFIVNVLTNTEKIVNELLDKYLEKDIYKTKSSVDLLKHISRFDIESSFLIKDDLNEIILHDTFVFPLYTETKPVYTTICIKSGEEIYIHSPILLVLYIKTYHEIFKDGNFDENKESLPGFQLTKEISKLFAEKIIQEDYLKHVIRRETNLQATKSAISSVMSRNMSHNIGSHVIPYLINHQADFNAIQTEIYNRYIQERMELIATIGTTFPNYLKTEITIDELIVEFTGNNVVLKGIVDGSIDDLFFITESAKKSFHLPGGQIGRQVFYSLLEGIIRNCKKHSNPKVEEGSKQISLIFKIQECENPTFNEDYYELHIIDQLGEANQSSGNKKGRDKSTLEDIREYLFKPILENGELRKGGWGILELKIAASLLIGFPLESIDLFSDGTSIVELANRLYPPVLQVNFYDKELNIVPDENAVYKDIGYNLFIKKAKLIYTNDEFIFDELRKVTGNEILSFRNDFKEDVTCDFFIGDVTNSYLSNYRVISVKEAGKILTNSKSKADFLGSLWKEYVAKNCKALSECEIILAVPGKPINNIESKIIFDSHGEWLKCAHKGDFSTFNPAYYQIFNSKSSFGKLSELFNTDILLPNKLVESATIVISIFDERIQNETNIKRHEDLQLKLSENNEVCDNQSDFSNVTLRELFKLSGVFIPDINLFSLQDYIDIKGDKEDEYSFFETHPIIEQIRSGFQSSHFVLIHHTILELVSQNLFKSKKQPDINRLYSMIYKDLNLTDKHLVIISGLGLPSNLPDNCFFLNLVTVQNILLVMKSKYHLVQVLKSLRPINNINRQLNENSSIYQ